MCPWLFPAPSAPTTPPASTLRRERVVRRLLDLIGSVEAPKGYNQMFGERSPRHTLVAMTINEVLELQDLMVRNGSPSSAAGRYQIIRKTLRDLMAQLQLTGRELFNEAMQDFLAETLMERRGLSAYLAGLIAPKTFANRLAMEWASFPVVTPIRGAHRHVMPGQSYYAGDGLNKALLPPERVLAVLTA